MVGRLIQNKYIPALCFQHGKRKLCLEPARKFADGLLNVLGIQSRLRKQTARICLGQGAMYAPEGVQYAVCGIESRILLVIVCNADIPPEPYASVAREKKLQKRTFARTVIAQKRTFLSAHERERGVFEQYFSVRGEIEVFGAQNAFIGLFVKGERKTGRTLGRDRLFQPFHALELFYTALRRGCRRRAHDVPVHKILQFCNLFALLFIQPLFFLALLFAQNAVFGIVAFIGSQNAVFQLQRAGSKTIEEIAVMRNDEQRALIRGEIVLQPEEGRGVKVVGRLIQNEQFGFFQKQTAQLELGALASRHRGYLLIIDRFKSHAAKHGADAHVVVIGITRRNALVETLRPRRKHAHLFAVRTRHLRLRFPQTRDEPSVLFKQLLHGAVYGGVGCESAALFKIAERKSALFDNIPFVGCEFAR